MAEGIAQGIKGLNDRLQQVLELFPEQRRELHQRLGEVVEEELKNQIAGAVNDRHGTVRGWQRLHIGSKGGYAALRPMGSRDGGKSGSSGQGAVTTYLERGHLARQSQAVKGYRPRGKNYFIRGRKFYGQTAQRAEALIIAEAERWMDALEGWLEKTL